jgi:hypothetical protein
MRKLLDEKVAVRRVARRRPSSRLRELSGSAALSVLIEEMAPIANYRKVHWKAPSCP